MQDLVNLSARAVVELLRRREVSPLELIDASAARTEAVDGAVNALPTRCVERARAAAAEIGEDDGAPGWLGGLPLAIKDLTDVAGVRTTFGSPIFADNVSKDSNILVERLESRGGLVVAKSNTPEFGAGGNTFNPVLGTTKTPYDVSRTSGGSSGGAASALATGQVWLAHGSDLGGSLRTPAAFCGVVGLRPSPGRVARSHTKNPFVTLSVEGPMARDVADAALMLDAMSGAHVRDPLALPAPAEPFLAAALAPKKPARIAYGGGLGVSPVDPAVEAVCRTAMEKLAAAGAGVDEAHPDLSVSVDTFQTLRAALFAANHAPLLAERRADLKPDMIWNIEKGLALSADEIGRAQRQQGQMCAEMARFWESYDVLIAPAAILPPFDAGTIWIERLGDHVFDNYMGWLAITFAVTPTGAPVLAIPCGFTPEGLPVGLQLVGKPRGEHALLSFGAWCEGVLDTGTAAPIDPRGGA